MTNAELHECISQIKDENAKRILFELMNRVQDTGNLLMTNIVYPERLDRMKEEQKKMDERLKKVS